jgi:hypothetical protein
MSFVKITTENGVLFTSGSVRTGSQTTNSANSNDLVTFSYI